VLVDVSSYQDLGLDVVITPLTKPLVSQFVIGLKFQLDFKRIFILTVLALIATLGKGRVLFGAFLFCLFVRVGLEKHLLVVLQQGQHKMRLQLSSVGVRLLA